MNNHTINGLANKACDLLGIFLPTVAADTGRKATEYRYLIFGLLEKAGYKHEEIAKYFKINRESVTKALATLDVWLKAYKDMRGTAERLENLLLKAA